MTMLRLRRGQEFEVWVQAVEASRIPELRRFVHSLLRDKEAVVAGLTLPYSNGPVEAQVQKRETWSSARCFAAPTFLRYGNACSMRLNLSTILTGGRFRLLLRLRLLLARHFSPLQTSADYPFFLVVPSKQAHLCSLTN
jgi:hypothetical protein